MHDRAWASRARAEALLRQDSKEQCDSLGPRGDENVASGPRTNQHISP